MVYEETALSKYFRFEPLSITESRRNWIEIDKSGSAASKIDETLLRALIPGFGARALQFDRGGFPRGPALAILATAIDHSERDAAAVYYQAYADAIFTPF